MFAGFTVYDAVTVGVGERGTRFAKHAHRKRDRQRCLVAQHSLERSTRHVLHHEIVECALALDSIDRDDARVVEPRRRLGLPPESRYYGCVAGDFGGQDRDRDGAVEAEVVGEKHHAHAAGAEYVTDLVPPVEDVG